MPSSGYFAKALAPSDFINSSAFLAEVKAPSLLTSKKALIFPSYFSI
ncbi:MAG: hypothetical protein ACD_22C00027G0003 [uncultured bacterium]|nr:MAG: hypothetical protein ACD_22C00027G0003 [uncultured bacterium]